MPKLDNPKHELFAVRIGTNAVGQAGDYDGFIAASAYASVYGREVDETAKTNARRLLRMQSICARVAEIRQLSQDAALLAGAAVLAECPDLFTRVGRARKLREDFERTEEVIEERKMMYGLDSKLFDPYSGKEVVLPGGNTGLVVPKLRNLGKGNGLALEHEFDSSVLERRQSILKQIAQELGQWVERAEMASKPIEEWTPDEWETQMKSFAAKHGVPVEELRAAALDMAKRKSPEKC